MSELVWACHGRTTFTSEANGLQLVVRRAPSGAGFQYQLLCATTSFDVRVCIGSGHNDDLRQAMAAAERAAQRFARQPAPPRTRAPAPLRPPAS